VGFQGYGNQADSDIKRSSNRNGAPRGFFYSEPLPNDKRHFLNLFEIPKGTKDRQVILLDDIKTENDPQFAALVHMFWYAKRSCVLTSLEGVDERGCPISHALRQRPARGGDLEPKMASSVWFLTALDVQTFTYQRGAHAGRTVNSRRVLIPVPRGRAKNSKVSRVEEFMNYAIKLKGLRLQPFLVSRSEGETAAKIGDTWWAERDRLDLNDMRRRFAADAELFGFATVDDYLAPVDYFSVMKPKTYEELKKAAVFIEQDRRDNPSRFNRLDDDAPAATASERVTTSTIEVEDEGDSLPF